MTGEWDKPITKALPGPVASESAQMDVQTQQRVVHAGAVAAHRAAGHTGTIEDCDRGCLKAWDRARPQMFDR